MPLLEPKDFLYSLYFMIPGDENNREGVTILQTKLTKHLKFVFIENKEALFTDQLIVK